MNLLLVHHKAALTRNLHKNSATTRYFAAAAAQHPSRMTQHSCSNWLLAFDFDHTIVDGNTDTHVVKAAPTGQLPAELKGSYVTGHWTAYMQRVLSHLHQQGVSADAMQQVMEQLPYTAGMQDLLQQLQAGGVAGHPCGSIILSDSNSIFIDWILSSRGHRDVFSHVYTNPAVVSQQQGLLVAPHHSHSCSGCPANMCKREVLQQHLEQFHPDWQQQKQQKQQLRLAYIGDGSNDLCPGQLLGPHDVLFVRAGYALDKLLQDAAVRATLSAQVHRWTSGMDILQHLQSLV